MSKIISYFNNKTRIDKTWYDSSNVLYSECVDHVDELKSVTVTFKNGSTYQYNDVNINDYMMFREHNSQGKSINTYIKKYKCEKQEDKDVDNLNEELHEILSKAKIFEENGFITLVDKEENKITSLVGNRLVDIDIENYNEESVSLVIEVLSSLGIRTKIK